MQITNHFETHLVISHYFDLTYLAWHCVMHSVWERFCDLCLVFSDVDECEESNGSVCEQTCENTPGSFLCRCHSGYSLGVDERSCIPRHNRESFAAQIPLCAKWLEHPSLLPGHHTINCLCALSLSFFLSPSLFISFFVSLPFSASLHSPLSFSPLSLLLYSLSLPLSLPSLTLPTPLLSIPLHSLSPPLSLPPSLSFSLPLLFSPPLSLSPFSLSLSLPPSLSPPSLSPSLSLSLSLSLSQWVPPVGSRTLWLVLGPAPSHARTSSAWGPAYCSWSSGWPVLLPVPRCVTEKWDEMPECGRWLALHHKSCWIYFL